MPAAALAQAREEILVAGKRAAAALHRLDDHRGQAAGIGLDVAERPLQVVEPRFDERDRHVDRRRSRREGQQRAVIGALEHHHRRPPGDRPRRGQRQQVGLGAGVAEPQALDRAEARDDRRRQLVLVEAGAAQGQAVGDRLGQRPGDDRIGMAEDGGGVLVDEIGIVVAVGIGDMAAPAGADAERERRDRCRQHLHGDAVQVGLGHAEDRAHNAVGRPGFAVGAVGGHRIEDVGYGADCAKVVDQAAALTHLTPRTLLSGLLADCSGLAGCWAGGCSGGRCSYHRLKMRRAAGSPRPASTP